jgi:hypothetical protein
LGAVTSPHGLRAKLLELTLVVALATICCVAALDWEHYLLASVFAVETITALLLAIWIANDEV